MYALYQRFNIDMLNPLTEFPIQINEKVWDCLLHNIRIANLGRELQYLLKVKEDLSTVLICQGFKLIRIKKLFFSVIHHNIFDHKYCIDPDNLFNI